MIWSTWQLYRSTQWKMTSLLQLQTILSAVHVIFRKTKAWYYGYYCLNFPFLFTFMWTFHGELIWTKDNLVKMSEDMNVCVICKEGATPSMRLVNNTAMLTDLLQCCRESVPRSKWCSAANRPLVWLEWTGTELCLLSQWVSQTYCKQGLNWTSPAQAITARLSCSQFF